MLVLIEELSEIVGVPVPQPNQSAPSLDGNETESDCGEQQHTIDVQCNILNTGACSNVQTPRQNIRVLHTVKGVL